MTTLQKAKVFLEGIEPHFLFISEYNIPPVNVYLLVRTELSHLSIFPLTWTKTVKLTNHPMLHCFTFVTTDRSRGYIVVLLNVVNFSIAFVVTITGIILIHVPIYRIPTVPLIVRKGRNCWGKIHL